MLFPVLSQVVLGVVKPTVIIAHEHCRGMPCAILYTLSGRLSESGASIVLKQQATEQLPIKALASGHGYVCVCAIHVAGGSDKFYLYRCSSLLCLQCFDAVGWAAGRASGL